MNKELLNLKGKNIELAYQIREKFIEVLSIDQTPIDKELLEFMIKEVTDAQWYIDRKDILNFKDGLAGLVKITVYRDIKDLYLSKEFRRCEDCKNKSTMECPNSYYCEATLDRPYFQAK